MLWTCFTMAALLINPVSSAPADNGIPRQMRNMVHVEGGSFQMGDVFDEGRDFERPVHRVTLSDFLIGTHEVTVGEFRGFVEATGYKTSAESVENRDEQDKCLAGLGTADSEKEQHRLYGRLISFSGTWCLTVGQDWAFRHDVHWRNPGFEQSEKDPVTCVSWNDAANYCNWLSRLEGLPPAYNVETGALLDENGQATADVTKTKGYRLPTEAEWEYAARERGKKVRFGNGRNVARSSEIVFNAAEGEFAYAEKGEFRGRTRPVGSFSPNSRGLHDMSGNVWEWCSDYLRAYTTEEQTNPYGVKGEGLSMRRAARGGRWAGGADELRASARFGWVPEDRCNNIGLRVARTR